MTDALVPGTALVKILKIPGDRTLMTFQGPRVRGDRGDRRVHEIARRDGR